MRTIPDVMIDPRTAPRATRNNIANDDEEDPACACGTMGGQDGGGKRGGVVG